MNFYRYYKKVWKNVFMLTLIALSIDMTWAGDVELITHVSNTITHLEQREVRDRNLGYVRVPHDAVWPHGVESLRSAEVEHAGARAIGRRQVELAALKPVADGIHLCFLRERIETRDAAIAADPQVA